MSSTLKTGIYEVIQPVVASMGLVLWGLELAQSDSQAVLRIYVDGQDDQGVTLDACAKVSRDVGAILDVEDLIKSRYQLEVSSPGLERPLFTLAQCARYIGQNVKLKLRVAKQGRRKWVGQLSAVDGEIIKLLAEDEMVSITWGDIQKANLMVKVGHE